MKSLTLSFFLLLASFNLQAQIVDSIIYEYNNILITKNTVNNRFIIDNKKSLKTYTNLKFVKRINYCYQVLDSANNLFYLDENWEEKQNVDDYYSVCGTVPHYILKVELKGDYFEISEDETFYDYENKIPSKITQKISINKADSVFFINGKTSLQFTSNFDIGEGNTTPRQLILYKNGSYFTENNPKVKFESIDFTEYYHALKTMKNNLFGILNCVEPNYKKIEKFKYHLAKAETVDGKIVFIDLQGTEY